MFKHIQYSQNVHYCVWAQEITVVDDWFWIDETTRYFVCEHCNTGVKELRCQSRTNAPTVKAYSPR